MGDMKSFQNILVGVDFDPQSGHLTQGARVAAEQAFWLAERTGASIDFLHSSYVDAEDPHLRRSTTRGEEDLRELSSKWGVGAAAVIQSDERPWVALTRRVLEGRNDLVLVAKRNETARDDRRLGSVSMKLIRKCPAPVWAVRPDHKLEHQSVVAATDLGAVGDRAVECAAFIAGADNCDLYAVHAWQVPMELQLGAARMDEREVVDRKTRIEDDARAHMLDIPGVRDLGDKAHTFVGCDSPSRMILAAVKQTDPDLLVLGTVSRGGLPGVIVGNTAEKLIYAVDCSLLAVKPDDFPAPFST